MTKVTKAQVEAYTKATTFTPNCKNIVALYQNGDRKSWEVYGEYSKVRKVNCARGQKVTKTVWFTDWHKVTRTEVAEILEGYGLTIDEFVAIANNDYEIVDNAVEEIDASEYAVSADAQEVAVQAEIENAAEAVKEELTAEEMAEEITVIDVAISDAKYRIENLQRQIDLRKEEMAACEVRFNRLIEENNERFCKAEARTIKDLLESIAELESKIAEWEKRIEVLEDERSQYTSKLESAAEVEEISAEKATEVTKFEEGKNYRVGDAICTVSARGDIAIAFATKFNVFTAKIKHTADCEYVEYCGMRIWATDLVSNVDVKNEIDVQAEELAAEVAEIDPAEYAVSVDAQEVAVQAEELAAEVAELKRRGATVIDAKILTGGALEGTTCITTKGSKGVFRDDSVEEIANAKVTKLIAEDEEIENAENAASEVSSEKAIVAKKNTAGENIRKEITYKNYQFFQVRIEKISNGQRGFMKDTQEKAVELLGAEIPQDIFNAVNSYSAFTIWLGREINPIIDDNGHKIEIQVSASGKSYFLDDAKVEEKKKFKYYLKSNRPICGAVPSGYVNAENFELRVPRKGYFYGVATYDKPLTAKQIISYDLRPEDDSEIEKVNNFMANCILINCLDDYFVNTDAAAEVEEISAENTTTKKILEILKRPHKSVIDWKATFEDMKVSELLNLQKDFKKYLKLGETDLAENIFAMLKTLCKNYRTA